MHNQTIITVEYRQSGVCFIIITHLATTSKKLWDLGKTSLRLPRSVPLCAHEQILR